MEAGSTQEVESLLEFMEKRSRKSSLRDKLHVIWYCLPVDNDRPLSQEEVKFFENGVPGDVPVVAIFTKFEWRITKAFGELRDAGYSLKEAKAEAEPKARVDFEKILDLNREYMKHPPAALVYLQRTTPICTI
jgi:hypothetical protein